MPVAVLWHLHQPEYRDPRTGRPVMPWTRLHAMRGYRDLLVETIQRGTPWTLNIVPGLWDQLAWYVGGGSDEHRDLSRIPAAELTPAQCSVVDATFVCGNPVMRNTPRYRELEEVLGAGGRLSVTERRDLQVLSTLVWMGSTARIDFPLIDRLLTKGRGFDEQDKLALWAVEDAIVQELPGLLGLLAQTEGPSVSTSPLHHPILPLLVDLQHASRSVARPPDASFAWPRDALDQLARGRQVMESHFGRPILGLWPSEGAVSPEILPLVAEAGFRWLASDEGVLQRSDRTGGGEGPWDLGHGLVGFFRDRSLSDRIGFDYARMEPAAAIADFAQRSRTEGVRVVVLDGENPWEAFPDAGRAFRSGMAQIVEGDGMTLDAAAELSPVGTINRLHTGSWIGADLEIWAGSAEDHAAWSLLAEARQALDGVDAAMESLWAAEGSDWFWWYGPEFETSFGPTFDAAFRMHLRAAWSAGGFEPPAVLNEPIATPTVAVRAPRRRLRSPSTWADWWGAGEWVPPQGSMAMGGSQAIRFGWDRSDVLWIRVPDGLNRIEVDGLHRQPVDGVVSVQDGAVIRIGETDLVLPRTEWTT